MSMSSPLTAKRRKLNESSRTLSKPFVSPLKSAKSDPSPLQPNHDAANIAYQPSRLAHTIKAYPGTTESNHNDAASTPAKATPIRKQYALSASGKKRTNDPVEIAAQRALTGPELQIRNIRNELDALAQAQRITSTSTDADLEELAQKWRAASQTAAEELFGTVKERVCRMGGVAAWRASEKKKFERVNGMGKFAQEAVVDDDADCEFDSQGEELPEVEQEWRKKEKARVRKEAEEAMEDAGGEERYEESASGKTKVWQEAGDEDDVSCPVVVVHIQLTHAALDFHDGYDAPIAQH